MARITFASCAPRARGIKADSTATSRCAPRVAGPLQPDVEVSLGQSFGQTLAPLHDDDGVVEFGVEVE